MRRGARRLGVAAGLAAVVGLLTASACAADLAVATVEAESGTLLGGAAISADGQSVERMTREGDGVAVTISAPEDGFYDVIVRSASVDGGHKENYVAADGKRLGVIVNEGGEYQDCVLERAYLTAGAHEISVTGYWCWIRVDSVSLVPSPALPEDLYDVEPVLVNPNATENARRLMTFLCDNYGKRILSGQYCDKGMYGLENAAVWRMTGGTYPAILGLDMIEYSPSRAANGSESKAVEYAIEYWEAGGIVTFCWHWNAPEKYLTDIWWKGFYQETVSLDLEAIMDGRDEEGYELLMRDIDAIAAQLKRLQDAGVPVLWRPLHEASGGWFWWGHFGPEAYKKLYVTLYDRLTNVHGLNNLIWVWNGQDPAWYPGDEYVDIIGEDVYAGEHEYEPQTARFLAATRYTDARKLVVLSENGTIFDPELAARDGAMWGFFCTWSGEFVLRAEGLNQWSERYTESEAARKAYESELLINRKDLPDLKTYPLREESPARLEKDEG